MGPVLCRLLLLLCFLIGGAVAPTSAARALDSCDADLIFANAFEDPPEGTPACSDGIDNDGDGGIDFPADPGCCGPDDSSEYGLTACDDGLDNDEDGLIDFRLDGSGDPDCDSPSDDSEEGLPECSDSIDNDLDGLIDFHPVPGVGDPQCSSPADTSESF